MKSRFYWVVGRQQKVYKSEIINKIDILWLTVCCKEHSIKSRFHCMNYLFLHLATRWRSDRNGNWRRIGLGSQTVSRRVQTAFESHRKGNSQHGKFGTEYEQIAVVSNSRISIFTIYNRDWDTWFSNFQIWLQDIFSNIIRNLWKEQLWKKNKYSEISILWSSWSSANSL